MSSIASSIVRSREIGTGPRELVNDGDVGVWMEGGAGELGETGDADGEEVEEREKSDRGGVHGLTRPCVPDRTISKGRAGIRGDEDEERKEEREIARSQQHAQQLRVDPIAM